MSAIYCSIFSSIYTWFTTSRALMISCAVVTGVTVGMLPWMFSRMMSFSSSSVG
jgi:hypothetical protein